MTLSPIQFLALMVVITAAARLMYVVARRSQRHALQLLAREWRMHYSPHDRFDLSSRIAEPFPLPGAAEVRVTNLIYGTEGDFYRFIFSAEFTAGVTRGKYRMRRVVTFREPRARATRAEWSAMTLAPEGLSVIDQYKALRPEDRVEAVQERHAKRGDESQESLDSRGSSPRSD